MRLHSYKFQVSGTALLIGAGMLMSLMAWHLSPTPAFATTCTEDGDCGGGQACCGGTCINTSTQGCCSGTPYSLDDYCCLP